MRSAFGLDPVASFADIIRRNTTVKDELGDNAFVVADDSEAEGGSESANGAASDSAADSGQLVARQPTPATVSFAPPLVFYWAASGR